MDREYIDIATLLGLAVALASIYRSEMYTFLKWGIPISAIILIVMSFSILIKKLKEIFK